ncbi:MAG: hypothetical protein REI64_01155 [Pedobacter sp.]|uniref:hypothetical protein n=1 Tax=Pedobacter sp. TaxID=1411316 RepID=UPI0028070980|nr:hypothetical protein [Pedobacter sp.]MDQ8003372.1 hypothetical protein [Pedobacter sp.]
MKKYFHLVLLAAALIILTLANSCNSEPQKAAKQTAISNQKHAKNLNLSIFLDLSDRIDPKKYPSETMEIYQRDLGYIKSLAEAFQNHVNKTKISSMNETMQLFFEPEPKSKEINDLAKEMRFVFDKSTATPDKITSITPIYASSAEQIYQVALKENKFIGADIWSFFKNKVKDQCILPEHHNVLVIITDGYMYHQENKLKVDNKTSYLNPELIRTAQLNHSDFAQRMDDAKIGFIPATSGLQDLKVLVIGINPQKGKDFEEDIIKKYWADWFMQMGITDFQIKGIDLPTYMDTIIKKTLSNK